MNPRVVCADPDFKIVPRFAELYYLACPYSSAYWEIQEQRYQVATDIAAALLNRGRAVYSPLTHNFHLDQQKRRRLGQSGRATTTYTNYMDWEPVNRSIMQICHCVIIVEIAEWSISRGVLADIVYARSLDIPVELIPPEWLDVAVPDKLRCSAEEGHSSGLVSLCHRPGFQKQQARSASCLTT